MFHRQWFSTHAQSGLHPQMLRYEKLLERRAYEEAWAELFELRGEIMPAYLLRQGKRLMHITSINEIKIGLYFDGFWSGFSSSSFYLTECFQSAARELQAEIRVVQDPIEADISVYSCFPIKVPLASTAHTTRLLYLGENVRPYYSDYDFSFTTDLQSYCGRNTYLPVWHNYIYEQSSNEKTAAISHKIRNLARVYSEHSLKWEDRNDVFVHVGNNKEPGRVSVQSMLSIYGEELEIYGSHTRPVDSKHGLYGRSKYILCPENSYSPGYVTEKLIDSVLSGGLSIYWGCIPTHFKACLSGLIYEVPEHGNISVEDIKSDRLVPSFKMIDSFTERLSDVAERVELECMAKARKICSLYLQHKQRNLND